MRPEKSRPRPVTKPKSENLMVNDLLAALSRHKGLILLGSILGGLVGLAYYKLLPPSYESSATILLMQNDSAAMAAEMTHKNSAISQDLLATHIGVIQSRHIIIKALERYADDVLNAESKTDATNPEMSWSGLSSAVAREAVNLSTESATTKSMADLPLDPKSIESVSKSPSEVVVNNGSAASEATPTSDNPTTAVVPSASGVPEVNNVAAASDLPAATDVDVAVLEEKPLEELPPERLMLNQLPSIAAALSEGESPVTYVLENLYAVRGGEHASADSQILTVSFRHHDPVDAQKIVTAVIKEYQVFIDSKFTDINKQAVNLIKTARLDLEHQIEELSAEYRDFRNNAPLLASTSGGANIYASRYEDLASELSTVLVQIDERTSRIQIVKDGVLKLAGPGRSLEKLALIDDRNAQRLGILVGVEGGEADSASFQALQPQRTAEAATEYNNLLTLKSKLKNAISDRGPNHPEVKSLASQVEDIEKFLATRSSNLTVNSESKPITADDVMVAYTSLLENDLLDLERRKTDIEARMATAEIEAKELVAFEIEDEGLVRKMSRAEELYHSVVERLRDINMQSDSKPLIHEVIAEPLPGKVVSPTLPIAIAIALLGMAFFSGSGVLLAELNDRSVHSAAELADLYGTDIVAHLPDFNATAESRKLLRAAKSSDTNVDPSVLALHAPGSHASESFKALRTQLLLTLGGNHRAIAVTSACQGDGKSTAIANLAVSIAQVGRKVLLLDCDLRRPRQHSLFGLDNSRGLADVLNDREELDDCIQSTPVNMLSVITCGSLPGNPAELLSGDQFESLVETLRETYDFVLLDCPPLMPVSDAAIIASLVDGIMVVNQIGPRSRVEASSCKKTLDSVGARLLGLIVNRVEESFGGYMVGNYGFGSGTYDYRYGKEYGYGGYGNVNSAKLSSERVLERK